MTILLAPLETLINCTLKADPISLEKLAKLDGAVIQISLPNWYLNVFAVVHPKGVQLQQSHAGGVDVSICGGPFDLLDLLNRVRQGKALTSKTVKISGNTELAQQFTQILAGIDIDWEEQLSGFIGDMPAHFIGQTIDKLKTWRRDLKADLCQNTTEYLQEESHMLPSQEAVDVFFDAIDQLRHDVDRLTARITRLQQA